MDLSPTLTHNSKMDGHHRSPTACSRRGDSLPAEDVEIPKTVQSAACMTAADRIKKEYQYKLEVLAKHQHWKKVAISKTLHFKARWERKKNDDCDPNRSPPCTARLHRQEEIWKKKVSQWKVNPTPNLDNLPEENISLLKKTARSATMWTKSKVGRFSYQYGNFNREFPEFTPTARMMKKTPGPGSYGSSTSFLK